MKNRKSIILIVTAVFTFVIGICTNTIAECVILLTLSFILFFFAFKKGLEYKVEQDYLSKHNNKAQTLEELNTKLSKKQLEYEKLLSAKTTDFDKELLNKQNKLDDLISKIENLKENEKQLKQKSDELSKDIEEKQNIINNFENNKNEIIKDCDKLKSNKAILTNDILNLEIKIEKLTEKINHLTPKVPKIYEISLETIDNMSGADFEYFVKELLEKLEYYNIEVTSATGDYGVDVIAEKDNIKYAFQCKLYSEKVGNSAIQEVYSGKEYYNCNAAVVITNSYFTKSAISQAERTGVALWDRDILVKLIKEAKMNCIIQKI